MALDLRLEHKLAQQLVMTPQLQQAIKLLQLSHLEMADVLREELEQNPVLEEPNQLGDDSRSSDDSGEIGSSDSSELPADYGLNDTGAQGSDENAVSDAALDATPVPSSNEVEREIDWESYLDTYSYSLPATAAPAAADELPPFDATLSQPTSLHDHLRWQVQMLEFSENETMIAVMLIEEINDDGYLITGAVETVAEELEVSEDQVSTVLQELQGFDPVGVCARNLRECLLIQLRHLAHDEPLVEKIVDKHLKDVEKRNYQAIAKALQVPLAEVGEAVKVIATLEPRPGRIYVDKEPQYITPDIYLHKVGDDYVIVLNEDGLPKLRISNYYRNALHQAKSQEKSYIQEKLRSAAWLIRSIHMRQRTIYRVMESILKFQRDFFDKGVAHLKPLILKEVAEDVEMHESTISRVTTNKYVHTPQGIFELKFFFNSSIGRFGDDSIASESVREHIRRMVAEENPRRPLSDQKIVEILKTKNIDIARRTVAKYREMLRIPSSSKRKKVF